MDRTHAAQSGGPRTPEHLRWDTDGMDSHRCSLATASATAGEVALHFGEKCARGEGTAEVGPALLRRIALSPLTAKNLAATLRRLIEENDGGAR